MEKSKVHIVGGGRDFVKFYEDHGFSITPNPFEADLFQFTGGEDVTPEIYNETNTHSHNNLGRDLEEMGYFHLAKRLNKPMVGVCRGGQFLNVMCGGQMIQHVHGHTQSHLIYMNGGQNSMMATSTHHQMMIPGENGLLLAWGTIVGEHDTEVVFYEHDRCLCFQPHPEYRSFPELEEYFFGLVNNLLLNR